MRSLLIMVVVVEPVVDAIAQQSMASLLSLARECLLIVYASRVLPPKEKFLAVIEALTDSGIELSGIKKPRYVPRVLGAWIN